MAVDSPTITTSNTNNINTSSTRTAAQDEFQSILDKASNGDRERAHPDDRRDYANDRASPDRDEEDEYRSKRIDDTMKMPMGDRFGGLTSNFLATTGSFADSRTGVKGVIADARAYEEARSRSGAWTRAKDAGGKVMSKVDKRLSRGVFVQEKEKAGDDSDASGSESDDFFERWRLQRREELEKESVTVRNRRTSPSQRRFGRFDEVDADGYLDAIEKVTRETIVVVFVYDNNCAVSQIISDALKPLVSRYPTIHFVGVHYEEIEFDNAGVPAILAYRNCGDLFANLTYVIESFPEETEPNTASLEALLKKNDVL